MKTVILIAFLTFSVGITEVFSQVKTGDLQIVSDSIIQKPMNPLAPARAAFLSAIVPGLGQAYNKKYWKIPIVYGAIGTGVYVYNNNNNEYRRYRNAYKQRLKGLEDEFSGQFSNNTLINAQRTFQRNRDLSLLVTVGLYVLNIVDANVDAHLKQFNVSNDLSFTPQVFQTDLNQQQNLGISITYQF